MADKSRIEWTDATWNPVRGCSRVSQGCVNCYAEVMAARFSDPPSSGKRGQWGHGLATRIALPGGGVDHRWTGHVEAAPEATLLAPLRWKRPRRIFVNSTSDLFHEGLPDAVIDRVFAVMALAPQHTFQILTKRPERMRAYCSSAWRRVTSLVCDMTLELELPVLLVIPGAMEPPPELPGRHVSLSRWPLPNVWLGTSVEDQATADTRIPQLLATPAAIRFISAEPLLGPVDVWRRLWEHDVRGIDISDGRVIIRDGTTPRLDWVIVGGESGPGARPMHPDWARALRDQCVAAGTPYFFKQWGEWGPVSFDDLASEQQESLEIEGKLRGFDDQPMIRIGKKAAGRLLDGRTWDQMPGVA